MSSTAKDNDRDHYPGKPSVSEPLCRRHKYPGGHKVMGGDRQDNVDNCYCLRGLLKGKWVMPP